MAGAKPGVHVVQLKQISVPQALIDGEKFIKWDEDSQVGTPVTLKVDKNGYFLYWTDQNNERDFLDICSIRDTRTGKYARIPKDPKLRDTVSAGASEPLENKTLTVVHGSDFVNVNFINFCSTKSNSAKVWCDSLLEMAYNLLAINASVETFLRKAHIKVTLLTDRSGNIPIKNVVKLFAQHKDDKKRVEKALYAAGLPSTKNEYMDPSKFTWEVFLVFYKNLTGRNELTKIYESLICDNSIVRKKQPHLGVDDLVEFLNNHQRDPRLNEILYPYANANRAREIILQYEPNASLAQKGYLSEEGFLKYILSQDNAITSADKLDLSDDMTQPLCHYFINSSHNTYLTGHQFTGRSSVEIYRQCLLSGCRCVELDFWNGRTEEPVIVHGYTLVPEILAKDAIEAIADSAFKTSDYPVILSFENHCNPKQQAKIAQYCHEYFGDMLLDKPLDLFNLEPGVPLPSPQSLCRKIIIKNKKKHFHRNHKKSQSNTNSSSSVDIPSPPEMQGNGDVPRTRLERDPSLESSDIDALPNGELEDNEEVSASESEEETESLTPEEIQAREKAQKDKGTAGKESEAGAELSALVNYVQPVHFHSFELAEKRNRSYEMSSFVETQATALLKEHPIEFVNYNKRQLSRVYPRGTRVDSSNFMPQVFWNAGCQLVALNYQTLDLAMQLNLGIFEFNKRSGYLLKPDFMRRPDRRFDPFAESTVDGIIAGTVSVQVISGQFLSDKRVSSFVEVEMYGLPADTVRKKFRTKTVSNNGINPVYEEEPFVFKKVVLPDLTCIRMIVYEESGRLLGHRVLPVTGLRPGYRHISLRNEANQPLTLATLFVRITVKDYVPDGLSDFAEALANPIKYQSDLEKRSQQLSVLTDDDSEDYKLAPNNAVTPSSSTHQFVRTGSIIGQSPTAASRSPSSPAAAVKNLGLDNQVFSVDEDADPSKQSSPLVLQSTDTPIGTRRQNSTKLLHSVKTASSEEAEDTCLLFDTACSILTTDSVEKIMEHKLVKEKKAELDKKLESLKKKHLKEKNKVQQDQIKTHTKLVKKLSSKKGDKIKSDRCSIDEPEGQRLAELQRSHSEILLSLESAHYNEERDLQLKFIEPIFSAAEKAMKLTQAAQLKTLQNMHEKEKDKIKKKIAAQNLKEVKALSQKHKDKDELDRYGNTSRKQIYEVYLRVKREVNFTIVQKGVVEIENLKKIFERRQEEMLKEHEEVRKQLEEEKKTRKRDWEEKRAKSTELALVSCSSPDTAVSSL